MWSGRGRYLLKGFFQRSIFRAGVCRKDRGRTGGMCTVHLCQSDVRVCNRTTHIPSLFSLGYCLHYICLLPLTWSYIKYKYSLHPRKYLYIYIFLVQLLIQHTHSQVSLRLVHSHILDPVLKREGVASLSTGRTFKTLNVQQLFSTSTNPICIPDTANQTVIFQTLKQLMWSKTEERAVEREGHSWKSNANNNERNEGTERERERAVRSLYSLLKIIAEREGEETRAEPQWRHCGSAALPVYRHSVFVSPWQLPTHKYQRGRREGGEKERKKWENEDRPVKVKWIHLKPPSWFEFDFVGCACVWVDFMTIVLDWFPVTWSSTDEVV